MDLPCSCLRKNDFAFTGAGLVLGLKHARAYGKSILFFSSLSRFVFELSLIRSPGTVVEALGEHETLVFSLCLRRAVL